MHAASRLALCLFVYSVSVGCDSEPKQDPDSGTAGTSAGEGGEGGSAGSGATSGDGGTGGSGATGGASGSGGSGATSGDGGTGGTSGAGATGGSGGSGGDGGSSGTGGTAGSAGTGGTSGSGGDAGSAGTGGAGGCDSPADCDDGIDCTADGCDSDYCTHRIDLSLCGASQVCDLRTGGCRASTACAGNPDCMDSNPCTRNERCDVTYAACKWDPLDLDADGHPPETCGGDDFDDADPTVFPGAPEIACDTRDNDRDGAVDEGCTPSVCTTADLAWVNGSGGATMIRTILGAGTGFVPIMGWPLSEPCLACVLAFPRCLVDGGFACRSSKAPDCQAAYFACSGDNTPYCVQ